VPVLDILSIRDQLNALPFVDGKRRVLIGRHAPDTGVLQLLDADRSEQVKGEIASDAADDYLQEWGAELRRRGLQLERGEQDPNCWYVVQQLRKESRQDLTWMRDAVNWSARMTTVALEMVVPGLAGLWLDGKIGTRFFGLIGFALGVALGVWHLSQLGKRR
jgi:hypothetical protein